VRPVPIANPPNPFSSTEVEYLDELVGADGDPATPLARMEVFEDRTRKILATNDSPDLGFRWSVNPYRGCLHACCYCVSGDTSILMGDGTTKPMERLRAGETIYGTCQVGRYRRYVRTTVLAAWTTVKVPYRITLENGTELVASGDHRFLTHRGWKFVTGRMQGRGQRAFLTLNDSLLGVGRFAPEPTQNDEYKRGYVCGMVRGDAWLQRGAWTPKGQFYRGFRLALADLEGLIRTRRYLDEALVPTREFVFAEASANRRRMLAISAGSRASVERICDLIAWPCSPSIDWWKGFLAGIFDAEGTCRSGDSLRITNTDPEIIRYTTTGLDRLGFDCVVENRQARDVMDIRVRGGLREHLRFFHTVDPAIRRKRDIEGTALKSDAKLRVVNIKRLSRPLRLYDITTGTGDFIANGVVSHNCYARPGHEYLSFGAGTDFDRKIVVKPEAPALLREAFEQRSWKGEFILFSGVTDCYQPLEASYRLTRGCLEVCAEYKNPCGIITKAPLIERDIDVLQELQRVTDVGLTLSVPFWDADKARAIEPYVATPQRRIRTIERLSKAGLRVGVNVAPLIPGLGDEDMAKILKAARDAGAVRANFVFLRLPGSVKQVFEERLRAALPLRAEKVLARIREARGGKLYDARFGTRQRGEGNYAEAMRALFESTAKRLGLETGCASSSERDPTFQRPGTAPGGPGKRQLKLFE